MSSKSHSCTRSSKSESVRNSHIFDEYEGIWRLNF